MKTAAIKISIIIPVYNTPETELRKCIDAALSQTLDEVEVIIVDDGSLNDTRLICDEYSNIDKVKVIHKENAGLSAARNTGYHFATGEWITFVDADDWIEPDSCESLYGIAKQSDVDVLIFGTIQEIGNVRKKFKYKIESGSLFEGMECKNIQEQILDFDSNIATAWAKLIKKQFLDDNCIEHDEFLRQGSEGLEFNIRLFEKVKKAMFIDSPFYHYVFNPNSISAKHNEANHQFVINCFEKMKNVILSYSNQKLLEKLYSRMLYVIISAAITGYFSPNNNVRYKDKCKSYTRYLENPFVIETINNADISSLDKKRKLIIWCIKHRIYIVLSILARIRHKQKNKK